MLKIVGKPKDYFLTESPQNNPLRWVLLFRKDDTLVPQTAEFRCKDYLNDLVAKYHGQVFKVYGFDTEKININEEGCYFLLKNIVNEDKFISNISNVINAEVEEDKELLIEDLREQGLVIFIPKYFFSNTYLISLVSYLIRVCNNNIEFKFFEQVWSSLERQTDTAIPTYGDYESIIRKWKFTVPEDFYKYWYYYNKNYNSEVRPDVKDLGQIVHDNGVISWIKGGAR
jgi:hypothetical protein